MPCGVAPYKRYENASTLAGEKLRVQYIFTQGGPPNFWLTPLALGVALMLVGLLIFAYPELLAYFVAALCLAAGTALVGVGWSMRRRVTYRRLDGDDDPPPM